MALSVFRDGIGLAFVVFASCLIFRVIGLCHVMAYHMTESAHGYPFVGLAAMALLRSG